MYLGFQALRLAAQALPLPMARAIGAGLGWLAFWLLAGQRRLTLQHLAYAFGDPLSASQRRRIARKVFVNLGRNVMEWLQLPKLSAEELQRLVSAEGIEHIRRALAAGNGALMVTAHFGNWELIPLYLKSLGFEGAVLARRLRYAEYESFLIAMRGEKGVPTLARGSSQEVAALLRSNRLVGLLPDQDIDSLDGVFVNFFGHPAHTPIGPAALSVLTGAPIIPCFIRREGAKFRLVIEPPLRAPELADRAAAMRELTQAWSAVVESSIRSTPDHWAWMHRRWKTRPPPAAAQGSRLPGPTRAGGAGKAQGNLSLQRTSLLIAMGYGLCAGAMGCGKLRTKAEKQAEPQSDQQMSSFTLTGYNQTGGTKWILNGQGAVLEENIVTIRRPDATGFDPTRTAYLTASLAQVNQANRHVRMEHNVTIHTSDGLWLTSPLLYWIPDDNRVSTDQPVRIETDHMLLRGRGLNGLTQLKEAQVERDVEMVLNPSDHDVPDLNGGPRQVTITSRPFFVWSARTLTRDAPTASVSSALFQ